MQRLGFSTIEQLIDFIKITNEFDEWETVIFRLSATNGLSFNIQTQISNSLGYRNYIEFKKMRMTLNQFYTANSFQAINLEIKLKFPDELRKLIDPNNNYEALYLNLFCDSAAIYMDISFFENSNIIIRDNNINVTPITKWAIYVNNLYTKWKQLRNIS